MVQYWQNRFDQATHLKKKRCFKQEGVPPTRMLNANWINISYWLKNNITFVAKDWTMSSFARNLYGRILQGQATLSDTLQQLVRSNYNFIGRCHLSAEIVEEFMEEYDKNNSFPRTGSSCAVLNSCQSDPCCEGTTHARSRVQESGRWPTRSTRRAKQSASIHFVVQMIPLSLFWNWGSVIPTSVRILLPIQSVSTELESLQET